MKKLRILALTAPELIPPEGKIDDTIVVRSAWKTDYDVREGLTSLGHEVTFVGPKDDLSEIRDAVKETKPHIVFNLMESFANRPRFLPHVLGYLELIGQAYTGCNPVGMMLSVDKTRQRKILRHHRIPTPDFMRAPWGRAYRRPARLGFPLIVKSAHDHGSEGIARASVVTNDEKLADRVAFIHDSLGSDALIEEFVEGRELYLGILGNQRLETFPAWEMTFTNLPENAPNIATQKLKWSVAHQKQVGLTTGCAELDPAIEKALTRHCKRAYRVLEQTGYARFDTRLREDGRIYVIESNPNPELSYESEFPAAAAAAGYEYERLLQRILTLGLSWNRRLAREVV